MFLAYVENSTSMLLLHGNALSPEKDDVRSIRGSLSLLHPGVKLLADHAMEALLSE